MPTTTDSKPFTLEGPPDAITKRRPRMRRFGDLTAALEAGRETGWATFTVNGPGGRQWLGSRTIRKGRGEAPDLHYKITEAVQDTLDVG